MKKIVIVVGLILAITGLVYSFLPHQAHNQIVSTMSTNQETMQEMENHNMNISSGLILFIIGLSVSFIGWKIL